ncbi:hypothetical protein CANARDRAFT_29925 [[Candida] arabinofermentans NRRL YB-2248]|uniref:NADH-ubiquinone oxidoreductase 12 kDa subunit n=1 Tax=[Candida] arabinofermentans NRRL YB-2248 TaxID=983967 RepID=A0A1E4SVE9_9ASCO|nr:hypothetical protein CANARDRAFT_29925 [[Candida] arabinofermentans NRRL YB-2248]
MAGTKEEATFKRSPDVSFDEIDYRNPMDLKNAQESMLREQFVRIEVFKMVRKALENCFRVNGPNAFEECRDLADKYLDMLPNSRAQGYMGYQRNDPSK